MLEAHQEQTLAAIEAAAEQRRQFDQAGADQRQHFEEALDHAVARFLDELTPSSVVKVAGIFQESATQIESAVRSTAHYSARLLEKQDLLLTELREIKDVLRVLTTHPREAKSVADTHVAHPANPERGRHLAVASTSPIDCLDDDEGDDN